QRTSTYVYDAGGNLTDEIHPRIYDAQQLALLIYLGFVPSDFVPDTVRTYDVLNRVSTVTPAANATGLGHAPPTTTTKYDDAGHPILVIAPARLDGVPTALATSYGYDTLGNVTRVDEGRYTLATSKFELLRYETKSYDSQGHISQDVTGQVSNAPNVGGTPD